MLKKNIVRRTPQETESFARDLHPVLQRVYAGRAVSSAKEIDYSLSNLLSFRLLSNIDQAASLLQTALEQQKRIVIVADYDADGATACALAIRGLKLMGAKQVDYIVPDRFIHGYGLSPEIVEQAAELEPDLLVTVDNGISSIEGVALARSRNIEVLITDHHIPGEALPSADVIVNPNLEQDEFPSKSLAGVGVMFYVLAALRDILRENSWFAEQDIAEPKLSALLDLVALGTVADVVKLDFNNRILVEQGLLRIRQGLCVPGILALLRSAKRSAHELVSSDLGFVVGPRLNAAGRLTDMRLGIECLISDDLERVNEIAARLERLNSERREIQAEMEDEAVAELQALKLEETDSLPFGLCIYRQHWHQGVIGVLASKMKEHTQRPVIAFASESEHTLKGSARSIRGVHIRDVIDAIATRRPGIVSKFGGHAMAAGLSIALEHYDEFTRLFDEYVQRGIEKTGFDSELVSDGELDARDMNLELAQLLRDAGPWGQGFSEPSFDGVFKVRESRVLGDKHLKLSLSQAETPTAIDAIAFNTTDYDWPAITGIKG